MQLPLQSLPMHRLRSPNFIPLFLLIFGVVIRLFSLNQSLWLDEATTAKVAALPWHEIIQFSRNDFHPPLYYLLMSLWHTGSEVWLRIPSVAASYAAAWLLYITIKKHHSKTTALWASALLLLNPLFLYYSQEARMYALASLWICTIIYGHYFRKYVVTALGVCGALFTFYGTALILPPIILYTFFKKRYKETLIISLAALCSFALLSPLLIRQLSNARVMLNEISGWGSVLGTVGIKNLLLIPLKFTTGRVSIEPKMLYYSLGLVSSGIVWLGILKGMKKDRLLAVVVGGTVVTGIIVSFITPLLQYFRFVYLLPPTMALLALGYGRMRIVTALIFILWASLYIFFPQFHREDWKSLSASLPRSAVVYGIPSSLDAVFYYRRDVIIRDIRGASFQKAYVVPYTFSIYGISQHTHTSTSQLFRGGLELATWMKVSDNTIP